MLRCFLFYLPIGIFLKKKIQSNYLRIFIIFKKKKYVISLPTNVFCILKNNILFFISMVSIDKLLSTLSCLQLVFRGFLKNWRIGLKVFGVGYKFLRVRATSFVLKLGYSHLIKYYLFEDFKILKAFKRSEKIQLFSSNKFFLSRFASTIKLLRLPDTYKHKGLQLFGEIFFLKKREKVGTF